MRFLIIRFSSIGDIVLTTPVLRCLKQQVRGADIHYITKKAFAPIVEANPHVSKVHILQESITENIRLLSDGKYDALIDLHNNFRTLKIKSRLGVRSHSFHKLNIEKWLMTALKWNRLPDRHIVDRYLDTVSTYGVVNDGMGLDYFIPASDEIIPSDEFPPAYNSYTGIVIGAAHATKRLPHGKMAELVAKLEGCLVLLGGKEDREEGEILAASEPARIFNACGLYSLHQSASWVRQARAIVTHDTGLMHIAAAFRKPVISVWGNTIPAFGMYPYYGKTDVPGYFAQVDGLTCRPCSKIGHNSCPRAHFKCMQLQDIDRIAKSLNSVT